jgi:hypothetical protein
VVVEYTFYVFYKGFIVVVEQELFESKVESFGFAGGSVNVGAFL